jgi:hypothetical protein
MDGCVYVRLWRRLGENPSSGSVSADTHFLFLCFSFEKREREEKFFAGRAREERSTGRHATFVNRPHRITCAHITQSLKKKKTTFLFHFVRSFFFFFDGRANDLSREKEKQIESVKEDRKSHTVQDMDSLPENVNIYRG